MGWSRTTKHADCSSTDQGGGRDLITQCLVTECQAKKKSIGKSAKNSSGSSIINEVIADGENALHPTDRFGDYAVRFSGLKLVL